MPEDLRTHGYAQLATGRRGEDMGLDANYPAVTIKNETDSVPIYNDQHLPVGVLSANTSRSVNVTCIAQKSGGDWEDAYYYRQMNPAGNPVPTAGVVGVVAGVRRWRRRRS